jgi:hypothetical protein
MAKPTNHKHMNKNRTHEVQEHLLKQHNPWQIMFKNLPLKICWTASVLHTIFDMLNQIKKDTRYVKSNFCEEKSHMFGTGFIVSKKIKHLILDFQAKSHRTCML